MPNAVGAQLVLNLTGTLVYRDKNGNVIKTADFKSAMDLLGERMPKEAAKLAQDAKDGKPVRVPIPLRSTKPEATASDDVPDPLRWR